MTQRNAGVDQRIVDHAYAIDGATANARVVASTDRGGRRIAATKPVKRRGSPEHVRRPSSLKVGAGWKGQRMNGAFLWVAGTRQSPGRRRVGAVAGHWRQIVFVNVVAMAVDWLMGCIGEIQCREPCRKW
jgi:hypothetical protein